MRRTVLSIAVWMVATTAAAFVAWAAVGVVGDQVTDTAAIPLSAEEVDALGAARSTTTPVAASTPVTTTTTVPSPATSEPVASAVTSAVTTTTVAAPATTITSPATTIASGDSQVAAYRLIGGSVVVRWSASTGVTLVSATPESGWTVDIDAAGPPNVEVEFKGPGGTESKFSAQLDGGELRVETGD